MKIQISLEINFNKKILNMMVYYPFLSLNNVYKPIIYQGKPYVVNTQTPRASYTVSDQTGKLVKANIPSSLAARMLGNAAPPAVAQAAAATGRRGRPAGQPNAPRPAAAPAATRIICSTKSKPVMLSVTGCST